MISKRRVGWILEGQDTIEYAKLVSPLVILIGTINTGCFWDSLHMSTKIAREVQRFIREPGCSKFTILRLFFDCVF